MNRVDCVGMERCHRDNSFASRAETLYSMDCGSSWEVDLRSDADCSMEGVGKCHPRYTLGWRHNEVQLYRDKATETSAEYVHAYCDVWRKGRLDRALASPMEREAVRKASELRRRELWEDGPYGAPRAGLNVLVLVLRGLSATGSLSSLPQTLGRMRALHNSSRSSLVTFSRYAASSLSSHRTLETLFLGGSHRPSDSGRDPQAASTSELDGASGSLWDAFRRWGYVSAYAEADCDSDAAAAAGIWLDAEAPPADHVLTEPSCELDTQLRHHLQRPRNASLRRQPSRRRRSRRRGGGDMAGGGANGGGGVSDGLHNEAGTSGGDGSDRASCDVSRATEDDARALALGYARAFLLGTYPGLPKLAVAVLPKAASPPAPLQVAAEVARLPAGHADESPDPRDSHVAQLLGQVSEHAPHTAIVLLSDLPATFPDVLSVGSERAPAPSHAGHAGDALPALHVLLPRGLHPAAVHDAGGDDAGVHAALQQNADLPVSTADIHATLRQLPLLQPRIDGPPPPAATAAAAAPPSPALPSLLQPTCYQRGLPAHGVGHVTEGGHVAEGSHATQGPWLPAMGGCSLLHPLPPSRSCMHTLVADSVCALSRGTHSAPSLPLTAEGVGAAGGGMRQSTPPALDDAPLARGSPVSGGRARTTLACNLQKARARAAVEGATAPRGSSRGSHSCGGGSARVSCVVEVPPPDATLLAEVGGQADMVACDAPTFASISYGVLTLRCPPHRRPMYSMGLHPKLHRSEE